MPIGQSKGNYKYALPCTLHLHCNGVVASGFWWCVMCTALSVFYFTIKGMNAMIGNNVEEYNLYYLL